MKYKAGFVAIIGRPNAGKSTLLNKILGQKIVIATDKPQTTRRKIKGIYSCDRGQAVFVDTPGIYKPWDKFGELLFDEAKTALPDADVILFVVDATEPPGKGDRWIASNILNTDIPVIIVCNKVELIKNEEKKFANINAYKTLFEKNLPLVKISAKTGRNIDTLIDNIFRKLPKGEKIYDEDEVTDETTRSIVEEIVREKILMNVREEIPHSVAVRTDSYKEEENIDKITMSIIVEHDSQKMILIGKNGQMIKKIGTAAREEAEKAIDKKIFLELNVKVIKNWRKNLRQAEKLL